MDRFKKKKTPQILPVVLDYKRYCLFTTRYNESGFMQVAGFAEPNLDPQSSDTELWNANLQKVPIDISVEKAKFLLGQVGYKFCELFHQEKEAFFEHMSEGGIYKQYMAS